jgi:cardiolipin synthase (CMP-forming)
MVDRVTNSARQAKQQKGSIVAETQISNRLLTAPNFLCVIRLLGSVVLVPVAWQGYQQVFLWLFLFLAMTDWADGKLANMLNQRSVFGARLDSWADTTLYAALLAGIAILYGETLRAEIAWVLPPVGCFLLSVAAGFWKFGRWPSYHTRTAKITWLLAMLGTIALFTDWSLWPLRIAFAAGTLSNLEALLITIISPTWRVDVRSIYHVWKNR